LTDKDIPSDHILGFARSLLSHRVGGRHKPHEVFQTSTIDSPRIRIDTEGDLHLSLQATDEFVSTRFGGNASADITSAVSG